MNKYFLAAVILLLSISTIFSQTKNEKLTGQVVCSLCWFEEEDRNKSPYGNAADIECAVECAEKGKGQSIAVKNEKGEFVLYEMEKGSFAMKAKNFLEFVPKTVEIEGNIRESKGKKIIKVNALKIVKTVETPNLPVDAKLALNDLSGVPQDLKTYNGRFVVVNFWATWCVPCKEEMPDLATIQNEYAPLGVQVIGATADEEKDKAKVLKFVREVKVNFPIWMALKNADMEAFGVGKALPATVIVNREGKIVWRKVGKIDAVEFRKELDKLLDAKVAHSKMRDKKKDLSSLVPA
ncbi:MAG: TlpA disulfide reductase family protein [Acidobacteriota bacterium]